LSYWTNFHSIVAPTDNQIFQNPTSRGRKLIGRNRVNLIGADDFYFLFFLVNFHKTLAEDSYLGTITKGQAKEFAT